jgi:capsular polysaccharide transport system permease protein
MVERVDEAPRLRPLASGRSVMALVLREMGTTSGRTSGGYLWAIAEPAAGIALLTLVFSLMMRSPPLGTSFPVFYATGILPFVLYNDVSGKLALAIRFSKPLLFYPRLTFADALIARFLLSFMTQIMVVCAVSATVLAMSDSRSAPHALPIVLAILMAAALGIGIGTMNCFLFSMFPSWSRIWGVVTRPLFLISGVFYTFESLPRIHQEWLWWNPLIHVVGQMRRGFYPTYEAEYVNHVYVFTIALVLTAGGLMLLGRHHRDILDL